MSDEKIPGYSELSIPDFQERLGRLLERVRKKRTARAHVRKEKPDLSLEAIANAGGIGLRTLHNWRSKKLETLPKQSTIIYFCENLGENPIQFALYDPLPEEEKIRIMNESRADTLGIKDSFMDYLKHEPVLEAEFANSIPREDHTGYTGYQLTDYYGETRYPDVITAYVIRLIQAKTEKFILSSLNGYRRMSHSFTGANARAAFIGYLQEEINDLEEYPHEVVPIVDFSSLEANEGKDKENGHS